MSKQPKKSGANAEWINFHIGCQAKPSSIRWPDVVWWREIEEVVHPVFLTAMTEFNQDVIDAKQHEIYSFTNKDVFIPVENEGQSTISCKWIFTE